MSNHVNAQPGEKSQASWQNTAPPRSLATIASPFKTDLGRERFLTSRRLDDLPATVYGYQCQGLLGGRATFATWNHRFEPLAFEPRTNSYKVRHCFNYEKPNGNARYWETNLWFSLDGMKALASFSPIDGNGAAPPLDNLPSPSRAGAQ